MSNSSKNVNPPPNSTNITQAKSAFKLAKSGAAMLKAFNKLESLCQEPELGLECFQLAHQLHEEGHDPEKVISFGKKALKILLGNQQTGTLTPPAHGWSMPIGSVLFLLGSASFRLRKYDNSLRYLNWSSKTLSKLVESTSSDDDKSVLLSLHDTLNLLCKVKFTMGSKKDEIGLQMTKVCEIKEMILGVGEASLELCEAYKATYCFYYGAMQYEEALPYCLKALEAYTKCLGADSGEVADLRRHLGMLYNALGEPEKGLEQLSVVSKTKSSDMFKVGIQKGSMMIDAGRYDEAIETMRPLISHDEISEYDRGCALVSVARALCAKKKFADAKKYVESGRLTLESQELDPCQFCAAFLDIALVYEKMDDLKNSILVLRRVMAVPDIPQTFVLKGYERLFTMVFRTGTDEEAITYLNDAVERLKDSFGPEHLETGYGYLKLGGAYLDLHKPLTAVTYLTRGKDILEASLGPNDLYLLNASQLLSSLYGNMGRFDDAIALQEKVVKGYEGLGPSERENLDDAVRLLRELKEGSGIPLAQVVASFVANY